LKKIMLGFVQFVLSRLKRESISGIGSKGGHFILTVQETILTAITQSWSERNQGDNHR